MIDLQKVLAGVSVNDYGSALKAIESLNEKEPELASIVVSVLSKAANKVSRQSKLIETLYKKLDEDLPRIKYNIEVSVVDNLSALQAYNQCDSHWFKKLVMSPDSLKEVAGTLINQCAKFNVTNSFWESIRDGDPATLNSLV